MCLKKKKDTKKKNEASVRSASRLDNKEKKLVSKEMHAVYNEHMEKKQFEFKPANVEEIDAVLAEIDHHHIIHKENHKEQMAEKVSVKSKKTLSGKSSRCSSALSNNVSIKPKQDIIKEDFVMVNGSIKSHHDEENEPDTSCNNSEICEKEIQEKQIDLSSECSSESIKHHKVDVKHILNETTKIEKEIDSINNEMTHNEVTHNEMTHSEMTHNEITHSEITHSEVTNTETKHMETIENKIVNTVESHEKSDGNHVDILHPGNELKSEPLEYIHVCNDDCRQICGKEETYLGYYIPDKESVGDKTDILENIHGKKIKSSIENLVEEIKGTISTVEDLVGEKKLNHFEDENNNSHLDNHKHIHSNSNKHGEENVIMESVTIKNSTHNLTTTNIENVHKENIITTTFYEEILEPNDDVLKNPSNECNIYYNSPLCFEDVEHTTGKKTNSIKKSKTNSEISFHNEKSNTHHNSSNEIHSENKIVNHSHKSSIHSNIDRNIISPKKNSINYSVISNVSTISNCSVEKVPSIKPRQSKSLNYSSAKNSSKHSINDSEISKQIYNDNTITQNSNNLSLLYKSKRKAGSIKSIDTTLSYGYPTKKHVIEKKNYNEIKKITEYQLDNKMDYNGRCNGYYLIKPQMTQIVCKYTGGVKIIIGGSQNKSVNDKKIILFGTKGSGKTTLVNNYCNILYGVGRECNFRFVVNSPDEIESTKNIVTYEFNNTILGHKFTIVDTPGFDCTKPSAETFSYKSLYEIYLKNYISKANRILIHGVGIVVRDEDDIWNSKFYRQVSGIRRIFCGNYENKNLYPIVTNAKAFSKLNYFTENLHGVYDHNDSTNDHYRNESNMRKNTKRRANWYADIFRITSNIYETNFEGKKTLDKIYLFNETEAASDRLFTTLQNNLPILLKKKQGRFETIHEY
ncbi:GTP binding domain and P-loop containing nucleoside triphosphate hydrolase domain-containing protein [Strongyloides ratti]|uniref:GTP binding domain and P-loop containing nucleoside triphosphate hydrolase domain-containing protein n=1 Tax=Strongyloides ratti TaxID=34506 RepID=A0A090LK05_STRRB|nr:GTP binding domain and P-loop containing nucleoside triphosphate hydrolase domain-containing protein [Strongyloides ratti]CEF67870.1 GTP binding domain and P-loop containing nucleoside triphosphate hydrolase domain-containing protein [Strongyloides ratti]